MLQRRFLVAFLFVSFIAACTTATKKEEPAPEPSPSVAPVAKPGTEPLASPTPSAEPEPKEAKRLRVPVLKPAPGAPTPGKLPPATERPKVVPSAALPEVLQKIEIRYTEAGTLRADYTQVAESKALKTSKKTSGTLEVERPDKLRWAQEKPDKNLLVSDGTTFWFYTPPFDEGERGQLIRRKTSQVQSRLATTLLSGSFSSALSDLSIEQRSPHRFELKPKPGTAGSVALIELEVDAKTETIRQVVLRHRDGNQSTVSLENIRLGEKFDPSRFRFATPANTDLIDR